MINTLVDKFNTVTVDVESLISPADQIVVDKIELRYKEVKSNLETWREALARLNKEIPGSSFYELEKNKRGDGSHWYTVDHDFNDERGPHDWASRLFFAPAYAFKYIAETLELIRLKRNKAIVDYFSCTYNLGLTASDEDLENLKAVSDVIDFLVSENDGRSFVEAGTSNVIKNFQNIFWDGVLIKEKIVFPSVYITSGGTIDPYSDKASHVVAGLSFFETGELQNHQGLSKFFLDRNEKIPIGVKAECTATEKFKAIRLYKNSKCELFFRDATTACEFYEMFKLAESKY